MNPTDYLNPYDFLDVVDHRKIGVYSASLDYTLGPLRQTIVVIPTFTPSRDALATGRWALRALFRFPGVIDDREFPPDGPSAIQYATRVGLTLHGWNVAASYYSGFENTPVFRRSVIVEGPLVVLRVTPVYTRYQAAGFDLSTTFRSLEIHGETALKFVDRRGREDRMESIVGINYGVDAPRCLGVQLADRPLRDGVP